MDSLYVCRGCESVNYDDDYCTGCGKYGDFETYYPASFVEWYHRLGQFQFRFKDMNESFRYWINNIINK